jgi:hypothetical protein
VSKSQELTVLIANSKEKITKPFGMVITPAGKRD